MDTDGAGIYGVSAGGQSAMNALLWHGGFLRCRLRMPRQPDGQDMVGRTIYMLASRSVVRRLLERGACWEVVGSSDADCYKPRRAWHVSWFNN